MDHKLNVINIQVKHKKYGLNIKKHIQVELVVKVILYIVCQANC